MASISAVSRKPPHSSGIDSSCTGPPPGWYVCDEPGRPGRWDEAGEPVQHPVGDGEHLVALGLGLAHSSVSSRSRSGSSAARSTASEKSSARLKSSQRSSSKPRLPIGQLLLVEDTGADVVWSWPSIRRGRSNVSRASRSTGCDGPRRHPDRRARAAGCVPSTGCWVDPVDHVGCREPDRRQNGRHEVDHVRELGADTVPGSATRPGQCTMSGVRVPPSQV